MNIISKISNKGPYYEIHIRLEQKGQSTRWENGIKIVRDDVFEDTVVIFGQKFDTVESAEKFMSKKLFKDILKSITKNITNI